jgi:uncharacterized membrane protein
LAVRLHQLYETRGYDLGIFSQYAKAFAYGDAPTSQYRAKSADLSQSGPNLFGDHFSPILAVLGPIYRLVPHVETLLVVQAALVAISAFVVARCAARRLGARSGLCTGVAYALSWGTQQLIGFDFHEVAFGLPLLSLAVVAYFDGRFKAAAVWAAMLLLVKEDMGMTVFVFGLLLWRRDRAAARVLCVLGPLVMATALFVVIPHSTMAGSLGRLGSDGTQGGGFGPLLTHPWLIPVKMLFPPVKMVSVLMVLLPTAFLALRSPVVLLALPTLFWRFSADTPNYWGLSFHYSAILMPIVFLAMIDAVARSAARSDESELFQRLVRVGPRFALVLAVGLCAAFPLNHLARADFRHTPARSAAAQRAVDRIPRNARVAATAHLVPHLVDKATAYQLFDIKVVDDLPQPVDWVVADLTEDGFNAPGAGGLRLLRQIRDSGFHEVSDEDGFLVLQRSP